LRPDGIRGVVLDLDDTLTDLATFELEVWDDVAKMLAERFPQVDRDELRGRYVAAMDRNYQRVLDGELDIRGYRRARLEEALTPWTDLPDAVFEDYFRIKQRLLDEVPPKAGAHDALRALRAAGLRLAILTNGPSDMQREKLERLGYLPLVDEVAISAEIGAAKPDRAAYDAVVDMLGLPREQLVMVGDNWDWDIAGALDAGMAAAYYVGPDDPPPREGAHRLASVADLPAALGLVR
jgi:HAD superfamily hydrolase (TIGR01549 family)